MADIYNSDSNTLIVGTAEGDSIVNYGEHVTINAGDGNNFVQNGKYAQTVDNGFYGYILTGAGNDTIENRGRYSTIYAGAGNDSIRTDVYGSHGGEDYRNVTVFGGAGDDTLEVNDHETSLNGGAGNDIISVQGSWSTNTLQGGTGDDTIYGSNSTTVFFYQEGDGYDVVYNFKDGDTIQINSATPYYYIGGDDPFIANTPWATLATAEDAAVIVGTGGMLIKGGLDTTPNISYGYSINVDLTALTGTETGAFVVSTTVTEGGDVIVDADATFKFAPETGDIIVGYVAPGKIYVADSTLEKLNRQNITLNDDWNVTATAFNDTLNVVGNNAVINGLSGEDVIIIGESVTSAVIVGLETSADQLAFATAVQEGSLVPTATESQLVLNSEAMNLALIGQVGLTEDLLNFAVTNGDTTSTVRQLLYTDEATIIEETPAVDETPVDETPVIETPIIETPIIETPIIETPIIETPVIETPVIATPTVIAAPVQPVAPALPIFGDQNLSGRIMFAQWGYGFTPPDTNPLITGIVPPIATSFDLAEDFGSPTLDEISPENFAVTSEEVSALNSATFDVTEAILASNKLHSKEVPL